MIPVAPRTRVVPGRLAIRLRRAGVPRRRSLRQLHHPRRRVRPAQRLVVPTPARRLDHRISRHARFVHQRRVLRPGARGHRTRRRTRRSRSRRYLARCFRLPALTRLDHPLRRRFLAAFRPRRLGATLRPAILSRGRRQDRRRRAPVNRRRPLRALARPLSSLDHPLRGRFLAALRARWLGARLRPGFLPRRRRLALRARLRRPPRRLHRALRGRFLARLSTRLR